MNTYWKFIIIVNLLLVIKLIWDTYNKKVRKRIINHSLSALIDGILYSAASLLLFHFVEGWKLIECVGVVFLATSYRWIFFDAIFAKINYGTWDKHGQSSKVDQFLLWFDKRIGRWHVLIKLVPVAIGMSLILIW